MKVLKLERVDYRSLLSIFSTHCQIKNSGPLPAPQTDAIKIQSVLGQRQENPNG